MDLDHFNLHPARLSLHPVLCSTFNIIRTLILHVSGSFPKFRSINFLCWLKIGTHGIWRMLILILALVFWICGPKSIFVKICAKRSNLSILTGNWHTEYLKDADSYSVISFSNFLPEIYFWANLGRKKLFVLPENRHMPCFEDADSYCNISFLNFQSWIHFWPIWAEKVKAFILSEN